MASASDFPTRQGNNERRVIMDVGGCGKDTICAALAPALNLPFLARRPCEAGLTLDIALTPVLVPYHGRA